MANYKIVKEPAYKQYHPKDTWQVVLCWKKGGFDWQSVQFESESKEECERYLKELQSK